MNKFLQSIMVVLLLNVSCTSSGTEMPMVVSVSSDGKNIISSHMGKSVFLWNIEKRKVERISRNANIYSASFVKGRDCFAWQDLEDVVHVQSIDKSNLLSFKHFPTYGHLFTKDLKTYFSVDENWNIFSGWGKTLVPIKKDGNSPSLEKLLNLNLSKNEKYLLSSGDGLDLVDYKPIENYLPVDDKRRVSYYSGVVVWDVATKKPLAKLAGNSAKTYSTFCPDDTCALSACENIQLLKWYLKTLKLDRKMTYLEENSPDQPPPPPDFDFSHHHSILCVKFVSKDKYVRINTYEPYAILYDINKPFPLKYLPLGRDPFPAVSDYTRNAAIDSAPEAGILVMGQRDGSGIIVYKFDPVKLELNKIWVADAP